MKHLKLLLLLPIVASWSLGVVAVGHQSAAKEQGDPFEMIIRTRPSYHNDSIARDGLLKELRKYPDLCDEIWLFMDNSYPPKPLSTHERGAANMAVMARRLQAMGITPSIQGITIGHTDAHAASLLQKEENWPFGKLVAPDGTQAKTCYCPRGQAFLSYLAEEYAIYAKAVKPRVIFLDDDLRLTQHSPVNMGCYCDTCLALFNAQTGASWTRETLVKALDENADKGALRRRWIRFGEESLAEVARVISREVHRVSPQTRMGLQHTNFHSHLLEGHDWNLIFDAMQQETGLTPASRPGSGFYNDHAPRGMIVKAYDMARQIRRLNRNIVEIAPEIEGYKRTSWGKSWRGLCIESLLYLSMGCNQLSYFIINSEEEPIEWYGSHYFKHLQEWKPFYHEYASFNRGTEPGGLNPYISPTIEERTQLTDGQSMSWATAAPNSMIYGLAPLGLPISPEGHYTSAYMLDQEAASTLSVDEVTRMASEGLLLDTKAFELLKDLVFKNHLTAVETPSELGEADCYTSQWGGRVAVVPTFSAQDVNNKRRLELLHVADWVSSGQLPVIMETQAQMMTVPRVDSLGQLRSVLALNCSISPQEPVTFRLRGCRDKRRFVWKQAMRKDIHLKPKRDGQDVLVTIPATGTWDIGWIAIE